MGLKWMCRAISCITNTVLKLEGEKLQRSRKKWFRIRDTYGVEIFPGHNAALILAIAAALDQMAHD